MASLWTRMRWIFKAKANRALTSLENPSETLDLSYTELQAELKKAEGGLVDVATARTRVRTKMDKIARERSQLGTTARDAVAAGREDLAREALARAEVMDAESATLAADLERIAAQEQGLRTQISEMRRAVDAFGHRKEALKASHAAASASNRVAETLTGIGGRHGEAMAALERVTEATAQLEARAEATQQLAAAGALSNPMVNRNAGEDLAAQLRASTTSNAVEDQLAQLRAEIAGTTKELGAAPSA